MFTFIYVYTLFRSQVVQRALDALMAQVRSPPLISVIFNGQKCRIGPFSFTILSGNDKKMKQSFRGG
jgi:hypothetical protein